MSQRQPNVFLVSFDALRADHLGCYGYERDTSPNLDEFAADGVRFDRAYSASSHTREAIPALLTGTYPDAAVDGGYELDASTVPGALAEEGYDTAGFHSNPFVSRAYGFDRGFDTFDDDLRLSQHKVVALAQRALDKLRNRHYARAAEINERALEWLADASEPWFCWTHYMDTHGPYEPPGGFATKFTDDPLAGREAQRLYQRAIDDPDSITDAERQRLLDAYDGEIGYADAHFGRLLDALRERDVLSDALVIVTADHGDAFGVRGYYEHPRYLHDALVRVPMLVSPPGQRSGVVTTPVSTVDVGPTVGVEGQGTDLLAPAPDRRVFQQARGEGEQSHLRRYAVRGSEGSCFAECDLTDETVSFGDCDDEGLRGVLSEHVAERGAQEKVAVKEREEDGAADEEIDRRLQALGYKD